MLPPIPAAFGYRLCKAGRSGSWLVSPLSFQCVMVLPYLSSAPPEAAKRLPRREIIQASGSLPDPWAFHPSVVLTEPHGPLPGRQSHYAVMLHSCMPEAVRHLQAGSRSCPERPSWRSPLLWLFITGSYLKNVYSVVKVLSDFSARNNSVVTSKILCKNGRFHRDAGRPVLPENRPLYDPFTYFRSFMSPARISWAAESCF